MAIKSLEELKALRESLKKQVDLRERIYKNFFNMPFVDYGSKTFSKKYSSIIEITSPRFVSSNSLNICINRGFVCIE